jgi:hypothetical protein
MMIDFSNRILSCSIYFIDSNNDNRIRDLMISPIVHNYIHSTIIKQ